MYKYLSIALVVAFLAVAGFLVYEKYDHRQTRISVNNQIAQLEGTIQETESISSKRAILSNKLKSQNNELQDLLNQRDEEVLAKAGIVARWKSKYFKIKNASQVAVDKDGNEVEDPVNASRTKVAFEHEEEPLKVTGFTLTNPAYAEIKLDWTRDLKLNLVLAKTDDDTFRIYVDAATSDVAPIELSLVVDPTLFDFKWYEKIAISSDIAGGQNGGQLTFSITYDITKQWFIGPYVAGQITSNGFGSFFGVSVGTYPFRK